MPISYVNFLKYSADLSSDNLDIRLRAEATQNALSAASVFFADNSVEALEIVGAGIRERPAYTAGRVGTSIGVGVLMARGIGKGKGAGSIAAVGNFSATQVGSAAGAIDKLFGNIQSAGFNPNALSNDAVAKSFFAGASGIKLDFNSETGTVSAKTKESVNGGRILRERTHEICTFGEDGKCN